MCQCPLGLVPHFYAKSQMLEKVVEARVNALSGCYLISTLDGRVFLVKTIESCQCPHGLVPHFYDGVFKSEMRLVCCVNALTG